jgi:hypothetical protein
LGQKGAGVVAWQAKSLGSVADETADLLQLPLKNFSLSCCGATALV